MQNNSHHLQQAIRTIRLGGLIAYPTEAVYGLGCHPFNPDTIEKLLFLKQRDIKKGLILIAADFSQLQPLLLPLPETLYQKIHQSWPGPITWSIPCRSDIPQWLRGSHTSLAVRVTQHPIAQALCRHLNHPIISTSANIQKRPPAKNPLQVRHYFKNNIDYILPGALGNLDKPTPIYDIFTDTLLRI